MTEALQQEWIAGFWRRIGAIFIDTLLLGLVGFLLGLAFESVFVQMGSWGRLIGFVIALVYFGAMNSKLCHGQTIGKRLLALRVVDAGNQPISLVRSVLRYTVFAVPFYFNNAIFSNEALYSILRYPLSLVIFGGLFSIIYLYIFNRATRQSLHDLAVGTYVVNARSECQQVQEIWKPHFIVVVLLFVAAATVPFFTAKIAQNEPFKDMLAVQSALLDAPGVIYASVSVGSTTFTSADKGTKTTTYVTAQATLSSNRIADAGFARELAAIVAMKLPEALNKDTLQITLAYGYDIGIWSWWSNYTHEFDPKEFAGSDKGAVKAGPE